MSRFYVSAEDIKGNRIHIRGDEAHHILHVMRLRKGDKIVTFDGEGREYEGVIKDATKTEAVAEVIRTGSVKPASGVEVTLAQAVPKTAKIDFIIEKATELGVNLVIPLTSSRTIVKFDRAKKHSRHQRWEKIAVAASKQCGRLRVPRIHPVSGFDEVVKKAGDYDLAALACLHKETQNLKSVIKGFSGRTILVFVGPEGDFTEEEIETARKEGCKLISLGPRVLRVDTAALNVISILRYELG